MKIREKIDSDFKTALKERSASGRAVKLDTLRALKSEIVKLEKERGERKVDDSAIAKIINREIKSREEAARLYKEGGRDELAQKEEDQIKILKDYQPAQLSDEALDKIIENAIKETGATAVSDMGKVMGKVMPEVAGKADGTKVSSLVKSKLS